MSDDIDRDEVLRVLAGDTEAFAGIVRRWQRPLVNLAWRYVGDRDRAEEMAQEAFMRAFRGLRGWRGDGAFSTWLFGLAVNVFRSEVRRVPADTGELQAEELVRDPRDPTAAAEARDLGRVVRRSMRALPARYRDALILYYFHEMNVAAAARTLGIPEGTLKGRLHRGRRLLRQRLEGIACGRPLAREK